MPCSLGSRQNQLVWIFWVSLGWLAGITLERGLSGVAFAALPIFMAFAFFWSFLTSILVYCGLSYLGYFSRIHPLPGLENLVALFLVFAPAGMVAKFGVLLFSHSEIDRYRSIFMIGILLAPATFIFECIAGRAFIASGRKRRAIAILHAGELEALERTLSEKGLLSYYRIEDASPVDFGAHALSPSLLNPLEAALCSPRDIHWIVISRARVREFKDFPGLIRASAMGVVIMDYRDMTSAVTERVDVRASDAWQYLSQALRPTLGLNLYRLIKPAIERGVAAFLLVALSPLMVLIGLMIWLEDGGPAFYRQRRVGHLGSVFEMVKFRSMRLDAESMGPQWAQASDPRTTRFGNFLRKSRLDELPQLWNVFLGQMALIGPRPERPEIHAELVKEVPEFVLRLSIRPGITGWSQVLGGYAASVEESRTKLEYDLYYIQRMSPRLDAAVILKTILIVLAGRERIRPGIFPANRQCPALRHP